MANYKDMSKEDLIKLNVETQFKYCDEINAEISRRYILELMDECNITTLPTSMDDLADMISHVVNVHTEREDRE